MLNKVLKGLLCTVYTTLKYSCHIMWFVQMAAIVKSLLQQLDGVWLIAITPLNTIFQSFHRSHCTPKWRNNMQICIAGLYAGKLMLQFRFTVHWESLSDSRCPHRLGLYSMIIESNIVFPPPLPTLLNLVHLLACSPYSVHTFVNEEIRTGRWIMRLSLNLFQGRTSELLTMECHCEMRH